MPSMETNLLKLIAEADDFFQETRNFSLTDTYSALAEEFNRYRTESKFSSEGKRILLDLLCMYNKALGFNKVSAEKIVPVFEEKGITVNEKSYKLGKRIREFLDYVEREISSHPKSENLQLVYEELWNKSNLVMESWWKRVAKLGGYRSS